MRKIPSVLLVAIGFICAAIPADAGHTDTALENQLRAELKGKVFTLQHQYVADHLKFDGSGDLLGRKATGPWTVDGLLEIIRVERKSNNLEIVGNRIYVQYSGKQTNYIRSRQRLTIDIPWPADKTVLTPLLEHIFIGKNVNFADDVPEYWKPYLTDNAEQLKSSLKLARETATHSMIFHGRQVYTVGSAVLPPRAIYAPNPSYTQAAKVALYGGTVVLLVEVDESGKAVDPIIMRPIGMGLDDEAVETVRNWQFTPATLEGKPVPVLINVEVNFRIH